MRLRRIFALRFSLLAPFLAPLFSCGSRSRQAPPVVPLSEFEAKSLKWGQCPDDLGGASVDCTQAEVPLDWTQPEGQKTSVLVRRVPARGAAEGSLWLLDGGPGFAVLLDSIVPIGASLERVDAHADAAIEEVLTSCAELPACAERFEGAPVEASRAAIAKYAEGAGCGQVQSGRRRAAEKQARC